jgi:hypothetical protein
MTITFPLKEALNDAISSGKFVDTKITLFSRRNGSGRVCKPKALYASSHVLKSVPYFNDREFPLHTPCNVRNDPSPGVLSGPFLESEIKDLSETADDGEFAEDYGYLSDSDLEEDWDFESPAPPDFPTRPRQQGATYCKYKEHVRMGRVIKIQDVAFVTCVHSKIYSLTLSTGDSFQAFLLYLYTDSIGFALFGSKENRRSRSSEIAWALEGEIPEPSPKSIYRLADKVSSTLRPWFPLLIVLLSMMSQN